MENQHRKITGYRELRRREVDLMNEVKALGAQLEEKMREVTELNRTEDIGDGPNYQQIVQDAEAHRWTSIAKTHFQQGLMALTRAVAKPAGFF